MGWEMPTIRDPPHPGTYPKPVMDRIATLRPMGASQPIAHNLPAPVPDIQGHVTG
jgi:hypothetical protein